MTNEEEKILEEENDITLEEAAEEAEELQEEKQDEVKEVREEIPDDVRLDPDEIRERPVLRGGLSGAADPNMIQKHIDNFLAMLCGETPVDSNVRTSAEYWLKRLATGEGGSTKKIYIHPIRGFRSSPIVRVTLFVFNNDSTPYTSSTLADYIKQVAYDIDGTSEFPMSGTASDGTQTIIVAECGYEKSSDRWFIAGNLIASGGNYVIWCSAKSDFTAILANLVDGVNPIN